MAVDTTNSVTYFLCIDATHQDFLGSIYHWDNLNIATDSNLVWVKDFSPTQIESVEVKTIPHKQLFYSNDAKLFLLGSRLPERNLPGLLWTPIQRGLDLKLPAFNHNYFGLHEQITTKLISSCIERDGAAMIVSLSLLSTYMESAPDARTNHLLWAIIANKSAIVFGAPLLPLQGDAYWQKDDFLFPAGYEMEYSALIPIINEMVNLENKCFVIWNKDGSYWKLEKDSLQPLGIASFRLSIKK